MRTSLTIAQVTDDSRVGIGGNIANVGVHGTTVELKIDKLWPRSTSKLFHMTLRESSLLTKSSYLHGFGQLTHHPYPP